MEVKTNGITTRTFFNKCNKKDKEERFKIIDIKPFYVMTEKDDNGIATIRYFATMPDICQYMNTNIPSVQRHLDGGKVKVFIQKNIEVVKTIKPYVVEIDGVVDEYKCLSEIAKKLDISVSNFHNKVKEYIMNK